jgi:ferritin
MTKQTPIDSINQVMNALRYSLASYLRFARPWIDASAQSIAETIRHVAQDHRQHVTRIGELLVNRHGHVESRAFPRPFTGLNDLSIEYLLPLVIEDEKQIIQIIEASAVALNCDVEVSDLLAEVLDIEKRHLRVLERAPGRRRAMGSGESIQARRQASVWPVARWSLPLRTSRAGRGAAKLPQG